MPEDRFGDLGRRGEGREPGEHDAPAPGAGTDGGRRGEGSGAGRPPHDLLLGDDPRSAAERLAELDERRPPEPLADADSGPGAGGPRRGRRGRYLGLVAVAFAALIMIAAFNSARDIADERDLLRGPPPGSRLPDFAAPLATGTLEGDANVKEASGGGDAAGARPACEVRGATVVNICELRERGPVVLTFIVTRGADCAPELATIERIRREFPRVAFVAVVSGSEREDVARVVRERRVTMPVAVDRDGALVNLYRVGVCPTTVLSGPGGVVRKTLIGGLADDELRQAVRALAVSGGP